MADTGGTRHTLLVAWTLFLFACPPARPAEPAPETPAPEPAGPPTGARAAERALAPPPPRRVVGTWNLEHFSPGAQRGFPENTHGGPSIPPRTAEDHRFIAGVIRQLGLALVIVQEIGAENVAGEVRSPELDRLVGELGSGWAYRLGTSGKKQRVGFLFDGEAVELGAVCETTFDNVTIEGKGAFDRQGLYAHATFLEDGERRNDLVVFGVHLASGQTLARNHDHAMRAYAEEIASQRGASPCIPADEQDVLIAGDFNASRFDSKMESFWDEMEASGWDVLADDAASYPATRLSGVPLAQRSSVIDYIIVSSGARGLAGEEVDATTATVHADLLDSVGADAFRARASDHLPVTVGIALGEDTDARPCCQTCIAGKPCGDSCIAATATCHQPPGCACVGPPP